MTVSPHRGLGGFFAAFAVCAAALVAMLVSPHARACSCVTPGPDPTAALRNSDAVFEGRAYGLTTVGPTARYSFEVDRFWKGDLGGRVEVDTHTMSSACGRTYELGRSYLVYARRSGNHWVDNMCTRTRPTIAAAQDLAALGAPSAPLPVQGGPPPTPDHPPPVEPPRVEPVAPTPTPVTPSSRGCSTAARPSDRPHCAYAGALLVLLLGVRRRVRRP